MKRRGTAELADADRHINAMQHGRISPVVPEAAEWAEFTDPASDRQFVGKGSWRAKAAIQRLEPA
jgi:hypothetical protein